MEEQQVVREETKRSIADREIQAIYEECGQVSPELILSRAKDPQHPLHRFFEWNDTEAAKKWRLQQATQMLLAAHYVEKGLEKPPLVISLRKWLPTGKREEGFRMRPAVLNAADSRQRFIDKKWSELVSWCDSVADCEEFKDVRRFILSSKPSP